jgi:hypothetical protein
MLLIRHSFVIRPRRLFSNLSGNFKMNTYEKKAMILPGLVQKHNLFFGPEERIRVEGA